MENHDQILSDKSRANSTTEGFYKQHRVSAAVILQYNSINCVQPLNNFFFSWDTDWFNGMEGSGIANDRS
jgi:hypothetical protein